MRKLALSLSIAALTVSGAAAAQSAPRQAAKPEMTRAEAQQRAEARFARMDANRDGTVNEADRAARAAARFDRIDADRNGSISRAEFAAMQELRGDRRDARAERRGPRAERGAERRGAMRERMLARGPVTQAAFVERALTLFDRADADRNGTVTQAERKAARDTFRQQWQQRRGAGRQG
ncbi:EF-hand domain-containing protein [Qipengyuania sediminis]|uniref:EF-hand domain-containing protein n=1 Tax=Qipengyuania sediminis TaxID=1532023 RepID=UPI001059A476|nr:EF-hand domain-containing protein [Qipengyuania sediminis]